MKLSLFLYWHFNLYLVVGLEVHIGLPVEDSVKESVEVKLVSENIRIEFHVVHNVVEGILARKFNWFVLFDFIHDFDHDDKWTIASVSVHADLQLRSVVLIFKIIDDVVVDICHEFGDDKKSAVEVELVTEKSHDNFLETNVLEAVDLFGVVVGNKSAIHSSDLELESILDESSSDEIVVLSFEAFKFTLLFIDWIVHIILIPLNVVSDGCTSSGFDFENKRFPGLVVVAAIDLWTEEQVIVCDCVPVIVFLFRNNQLLLQTLYFLLFMGQEILSQST